MARQSRLGWLIFVFAFVLVLPALRAGEEKQGEARAVFRCQPEIDCPGCEDRIKDLLQCTRGVSRVELDLIESRLAVRYRPKDCPPALLQGRVAATGYQLIQVK